MDVLGFAESTAQELSLLTRIAVAAEACSSKLDGIQGINDKLTHVSDQLDLIYARLEHVKVDSFVNVRIMDDLGALPVPATIATGLLVSAFASEDALPVSIVGTPLPVDIVSSVQLEARQMLYDVNTALWRPYGGAWSSSAYYQNDELVIYPNAGCFPISIMSGVGRDEAFLGVILDNSGFTTSSVYGTFATNIVSSLSLPAVDADLGGPRP